jgi:hypothetical protein
MRTGSGAPVPSYGPASEGVGAFGRDMPGGRMGGPATMGNSGGPISMPGNSSAGPPANSGNPGGMPGAMQVVPLRRPLLVVVEILVACPAAM